MNPESIAATVAALGVALSKGRSAEEIALMASIFTQLADTLSTIAAAREYEEACREKESEGKKQGDKSK